MSPLIVVTDVRKSFAGVQALKGVSLDLMSGEVHAVVGENGAGKSTLIRIIAGAVNADAGRLQIGGRPVELASMSPGLARAHDIAVIYQQPALFPDLSVTENIALALEPPQRWQPIDWAARERRVIAILEEIGAAIDPTRLAGSLSMPEQQLVEVAKAHGAAARIVIMDEPTASLSEREVAHLFDVIDRLRARGTGVIYISHRLDEVFRLADRITVLRDGLTVATGPKEQFSRDALVRLMAGRELAAEYPERQSQPGGVALDLRNVSSASAGVVDVSLSVRRGEVVGLAGLVGSGRTELAETIFGLRPIDSGEILVEGRALPLTSPADASRAGIAYVPEDRRAHGVILEMPLAANTSLAVLSSVSNAGMIDDRKERSLAERFMNALRIKAAGVTTPVSTLSGGNQQKVALARWLATGPRILILDEPTQGVDVGAKGEIHRLVRQLADEGMAVLLISSELPEILGMSDRIAVMRGGTVAAVLDADAASAELVLTLALDPAPAAEVR